MVLTNQAQVKLDLLNLWLHIMFTPDECDICSREIPAMWPTWPRVCMQCQSNSKRKLLLDKLSTQRPPSHPVLPETVLVHIASFSVFDENRRARMRYLRFSLLARRRQESPFCKSTYVLGGIAGSISATEDILDRILQFLCAYADTSSNYFSNA